MKPKYTYKTKTYTFHDNISNVDWSFLFHTN